ncbi:hypothetical protein [Streptomyces sp. BE133]|uniref:hypothetical protein n=1 Tax=Streptomyces sp. BE133 TaxID=3002523 RepID=UPI002E76D403|nr:hypothetical protein [Streptomyces sp. BE133]MEE1810849.1 hypothetical protein [Streptomyces sp. BE133]
MFHDTTKLRHARQGFHAPAPERRRDFARWAVAQTPKLDTVGTSTFGVPAVLFTAVPGGLTIGALVDGHWYVSPQEDEAENKVDMEDKVEVEELLGVATPEGLDAAPEEPSPAEAEAEAADDDEDAGERAGPTDELETFRCD